MAVKTTQLPPASPVGNPSADGTIRPMQAVPRWSFPRPRQVAPFCGLLLISGAMASSLPQSKPSPSQPVLVQDYEKASSLPAVWVVNILNEQASVALSTDSPFNGKQCLQLRYRFDGTKEGQYLGIPNKVNVQVPITKLRYQLRGDKSGCGYSVQIADTNGETHQYKLGSIDFQGWKEIVVDLNAPHETWGGDKNGKLDYPLSAVTLIVGQPMNNTRLPVEGALAFDSLRVDSGVSAEETLGSLIAVTFPAYGADVQGNTRITLAAPGYKSVTVKCWKAGPSFGVDSTIATVLLDAQGRGSFAFPANAYPHGPITVRITGTLGTRTDNCYLQLYNKGGKSWNAGLPPTPPAAKGMTLLFADDFAGPLSISSTDPQATYYDHKPPSGSQDFSTLPFTGHQAPNTPFAQRDTYLRIRASEKAKSAGLLSSLKNDGSGIKVSLPCYFECRFLGPNAIGTWPAFWLMTDYLTDAKVLGDKMPCDELDVIEAYGGEGPHAPNAGDTYMVTPHAWNQGNAGKALENKAFKDLHNPSRMSKLGIPSTWYEAFHTYGCKVTQKETIYYCDNIEVGRHETLPVCKEKPLFFLINLATGGGWPVDLSRYDGQADMYVDFVRVYK